MATKKKDKKAIGLCRVCGADVFRGSRCPTCSLGFVADEFGDIGEDRNYANKSKVEVRHRNNITRQQRTGSVAFPHA